MYLNFAETAQKKEETSRNIFLFFLTLQGKLAQTLMKFRKFI